MPKDNKHVLPRIWIAFTGKTDLKYLRVLRPGFRHCYAIIHDGARWILIDPLAAHIDIKIIDVPSDFDLPQFYKSQGDMILKAPVVREFDRAAPLAILNCVEMVKRLIGLRKSLIITPYQLYRYLNKHIAQQGDI